MTSPQAAPPILVVERDQQIRTLLVTALQLEGYTAEMATTVEDARAKVEAHLYALVLTDSFASFGQDRLRQAFDLHQHAQPTPVGLLTGWRIAPTEAHRAGLAFLLEKPFDLAVLLRQIADALNPRFTPEEEQQAQRIRRALEALSAGDWDTLRRLLSPTMQYYPLTRTPFTSDRAIIGLEAYLAYAHLVREHLPGFQIEQAVLLHHRKGLLTRYQTNWQGRDGERRSFVSSAFCRFAGERISQIGVALPAQRVRRLLEEEQASTSAKTDPAP